MVDERRAHQCHRDNCDSEAKFGVRMRITCRAPGTVEVIKLKCSIEVCDRHLSQDALRKYVLGSEQNRERIKTELMEHGHAEPDFLSAAFDFVPLAAADDEKRSVLHAKGPTVGCDRDGCVAPAKWQIKQRFRMMWQRGKGKPMVEVLTKMCVCDHHRATTRAKDLMADGGKSRTQTWLNSRGVSMPDLNNTEIEFVPMVDGRRVDPEAFVGQDGPHKALTR